MAVMIETENLGRYFGEIKAVDGVSFTASKGDVLGFLGPNGAGKSTTMKMLTCFLTPSFGRATVSGFDVLSQPREVRKSLGYLPENAPIYGDMEVADFLKFVAEVRGLDGEERAKAVARVIELTSLESVTRQRIETLSKGFKRRVGLAQSIVHDPEILILDEPTDGLDPNQKHDVRQLINRMAEEKCIVLSTHILEEVDEVCNRVVIISDGKVVADDTPEALKKRSKVHGAVVITFKDGVPENAESVLGGIAGVASVETKQTHTDEMNFILYPVKGGKPLHDVVREAEKQNWSFEHLRVETGQLDEVFRSIT